MTKTARLAPLAGLAALLLLGACNTTNVGDKPDPLKKNVVDEAGLTNLYLNAGAPEEAVTFFEQALAKEPERADFRRGLAISMVRARRWPEAARVYQELITLGQATPIDRMEYGFTIIRLGQWEDARNVERDLPDGLDTSRRHQLRAMIADHDKDWDAADAAYGRAEKLATNPAAILNNWGVSRMSRGDLDGAGRNFQQAIGYDSKLFEAKNNLAIARALAGNYTLPLVPMTDIEKAQMLNNIGIVAMRQGKEAIAKGLFAAAVDTHPQHYAKAAQRLASLEGKVLN